MPKCCPSFSPSLSSFFILFLFVVKYDFIVHYYPKYVFIVHFTLTFSSFFCYYASPPSLGFSSKLYAKCMSNVPPTLTCGSSRAT
jgi:hypothetical protein